jgi:hypothetical protein
MNGKGIMTWSNRKEEGKRKYEGEWRKGLFHGKGRYEDKFKIYEGDWWNGKVWNGPEELGEEKRNEG